MNISFYSLFIYSKFFCQCYYCERFIRFNFFEYQFFTLTFTDILPTFFTDIFLLPLLTSLLKTMVKNPLVSILGTSSPYSFIQYLILLIPVPNFSTKSNLANKYMKTWLGWGNLQIVEILRKYLFFISYLKPLF